MKTYLSFSRRDVILPSSSSHKRAQSEEEKCELPDKCELINDVQESIESGGENRGYRNIRQRLIQKGKPYTFNSVRLALKSIDPDVVARRLKHRLKRRKYINCGPNYVWHIDGNDKLKPFGFCIHAGIDGFSRKILWLKVSYTNKDPLVAC